MRQKKNQSKEEYNAYMAAYMREQYRKNTEIVRQYKIEHGCVDCGYNAHHAGLEFDHREGRTAKDLPVARIMGKGLKRIMEEIEKCDVVCGTCHNIRTFERLQQS